MTICHFSGEAGKLQNLHFLTLFCLRTLSLASFSSHILLGGAALSPLWEEIAFATLPGSLETFYTFHVTAANSADKISETT